jgi:hypothetical protein
MDGDAADEDGNEAHDAHDEVNLAAYLHVALQRQERGGETALPFAFG